MPKPSLLCPNCQDTFPSREARSLHLPICNPWTPPGVLPCLCAYRATSNSQMKRHKKACPVWSSRDSISVSKARREATCQERYGVSCALSSEVVREKSRVTNLERYGSDNPFASEEVKKKIRASMQERYGVDYPGQSLDIQEKCKKTNLLKYGVVNVFADPKTQALIRATLLERYGAPNPQQSAFIRDKTRKTNAERYGTEEILSAPIIRAKIKETCQALYGGNAPSCSATVQAKTIATNRARYGVDWTCQNDRVRQAQYATVLSNYGGHFLSSDEGKRVTRERLQEIYGVEYPLQHPEIRAKFLKTRGITWEAKYEGGHPMRSLDSLQKMLQNRVIEVPNKLEQFVGAWSELLYFTGDGKIMLYSESLNRSKNPDFVVVPEDWDGDLSTLKIEKCVEVFGDYWHGPIITGIPREQHEQDVQALYASMGVEVLILWEGDIHKQVESCKKRLADFFLS